MSIGIGLANYCPVHGGYICGCVQQSALMNQYNALVSQAAQNPNVWVGSNASILTSNGSGLGMVVGGEPEPNNLLLLLE